VFTFHPRHLQTALTDATALIAKDIMERVPEHFDTYVGTE